MGLNVEDLEKIIGKYNMPVEVDNLNDDEFLKVKETLTRIGQVDKKSNTLFQVSHILHKKGRYFITHYKQMYMFDGKISNTKLNEVDVARNRYVAKLLNDWKLVNVLNKNDLMYDKGIKVDIKIVKYSDAKNWRLKSKYFNTYKEYNGNK